MFELLAPKDHRALKSNNTKFHRQQVIYTKSKFENCLVVLLVGTCWSDSWFLLGSYTGKDVLSDRKVNAYISSLILVQYIVCRNVHRLIDIINTHAIRLCAEIYT